MQGGFNIVMAVAPSKHINWQVVSSNATKKLQLEASAAAMIVANTLLTAADIVKTEAVEDTGSAGFAAGKTAGAEAARGRRGQGGAGAGAVSMTGVQIVTTLSRNTVSEINVDTAVKALALAPEAAKALVVGDVKVAVASIAKSAVLVLTPTTRGGSNNATTVAAAAVSTTTAGRPTVGSNGDNATASSSSGTIAAVFAVLIALAALLGLGVVAATKLNQQHYDTNEDDGAALGTDKSIGLAYSASSGLAPDDAGGAACAPRPAPRPAVRMSARAGEAAMHANDQDDNTDTDGEDEDGYLDIGAESEDYVSDVNARTGSYMDAQSTFGVNRVKHQTHDV